MIVRLLLWRLDETTISFEELRDHLDALEPLETPSAWLWSEAQERFGALVLGDDEEHVAQLDQVRALLGRDPDLYEEFDTL